MPSGFYWGGIGQGVGQGLTNIGKMLADKAKFDEQKKENELRRKMLDLQIQKATREEGEAATRERLLGDIATSMSQPVGQSIFQGVEEEGAGLAGPPAAPTRPKTLEETLKDPAIVGRMIQAQGKEAIPQLLKQAMPGANKPNAYTNPNGYSSPEEASAATGMPVNRMKMGLNGRWFPEGSEPVNWGARLAAAAYQQHLRQNPGDVAGATNAGTNAANLYQYMQGGYRQMGTSEAELAQPGSPLPPAPGLSAPQPSPTPPSTLSQTPRTPPPAPPLQAPQVPQPSTQSYGTPAGGPAPSRAQARAEARTMGGAVPEASDAVITSSRTILQQLDRINPNDPKSLYSPGVIGPAANIMGAAQETFGETPYIGRGLNALRGQAISDKEIEFRQAVNSIYNEIANLRGGKVLPEQELKRIEKEAATMSTSPQAFKARYKGFRIMIENILKNRIATVGATRATVGQQGTPRSVVGTTVIQGKTYTKYSDGTWESD